MGYNDKDIPNFPPPSNTAIVNFKGKKGRGLTKLSRGCLPVACFSG